MKTLVLGAGVIGTMTAYYLAKRGHEVEVVERHPDVAQEASFANGGIVHASEVMPWSQPGMPRNILRWLGKEDAPMLVRYGAIPRMWRWGLDFLRNCTEERFRANTLANLRLALLSQQSFKEVRAEVGHDYDLNTAGCLKIYTSAESLDGAARLSESMREFGMSFDVLDRAGCVRAEPALRSTADSLAGGIYFPGDELGDSYKFTKGVAAHCERLGVRFHTGTTVRRLQRSGGEITGARTDGDLFTADRYVAAMGSYTPLLLRTLGIRVPIYPVKGVSITMPAAGWNDPLRMPMIDEGRLFGLVPLGDRVRAAGSAEVAGYDTNPDHGRCQAIIDNVISVFPGFAHCYDPETTLFWAGLRPVTPSGTPMLGRTPIRNLFINAGHCHQGWTLSCGSGRVVADIVDGREPEIDITGLTLNRPC